MLNLKLYAILLGGKLRQNHLMENHHLVFVVSDNEENARKQAKQKWNTAEVHIDGTQQINIVDGYKINLEITDSENDVFEVNPDYSK